MAGYPPALGKGALATNGVSKQPWKLHKFGGTSVGNAGCFRNVQQIISEVASPGTRPAIVVSAMGGKPKTTDMLIDLTKNAANNNWDAVNVGLDAIRAKHNECLHDLFGESTESCKRLTQLVENDLNEIISLLRAVTVMRDSPESIVGIVSGYGEQWSAQFLQCLLAAKNEPWIYVDARKVLVVDDKVGGGSDVEINWAESNSKLEKFLQDNVGQNLVITGFIASTNTGGSTTLGRDGSDFSATVFGRLLNAIDVTIWTDVSGVMSADPRKVPDAYSLSSVSYQEAAELAFFGAKVVHPKTMVPAHARRNQPSAWGKDAQSIPIYIKNTFAPLDPGTRIFEKVGVDQRDDVCCGFTVVDNLSMISVEGLGMHGNPVASRLFPSLRSAGVAVIMIAQGSSEASLSFVVHQKDEQIAKDVAIETFAREFQTGAMEVLGVTSPCAVVAAVGDDIQTTCGVSGIFFDSLGQAGVNVLAITVGNNARAISAVVNSSDSSKALAALHAAFLHHIPIAVGIIGGGGVAEAFMKQIDSVFNPKTGCTKELAEKFGVDFRIVAIWDPPDALEMALDPKESRGKGITSEILKKLDHTCLSKLATEGTESDVQFLVDRLKRSPYIHRIIVDCSDSKTMALKYHDWAQDGIHVVTQNHIGFHAAAYGPMRTESFDRQITPTGKVEVLNMLAASHRRILRSAAVGRGLPLLQTLHLLQESGDRIVRIDGIFSISIHYLCTKLSPTDGSEPVSFEKAAELSSECGFFEKQYGVDMTGQLAKSQILLLAAELCNDDTVTAKVDVKPFNKAAASMADGDKNVVVRYVGELDLIKMEGSIKPTLLPLNHPFAQLSGKSRMTRFFTQKRSNPVAVSGPVGCELVGGSLFADCLEIARRFGAHEKAGLK